MTFFPVYFDSEINLSNVEISCILRIHVPGPKATAFSDPRLLQRSAHIVVVLLVCITGAHSRSQSHHCFCLHMKRSGSENENEQAPCRCAMLKYNARKCLTSRACKLNHSLSLVRLVPLVQPHLLPWYLIKNTYNLFLTQQKYCFRKEL